MSVPPEPQLALGAANCCFAVNARDQRLFRQWWLPTGKPHAVVVLSHGYAEHSGRYAPLAAQLTANGFTVYAMDHHGHGQSEGTPTLVRDSMHLVTDFRDFVHDVHEIYAPDLPIFLLGHSMGGPIALKVASLDPEMYAGVLLCSPMLCVIPDAWESPLVWLSQRVLPTPLSSALRSSLPTQFFQFLKSVVCSTVHQAVKQLLTAALLVVPETLPTIYMDGDALSHNPEVLEACMKDPLVEKTPLKIRTVHEMFVLTEISQTPEVTDRCTFPVAAFHGTADTITPIAGTLTLLPRLATNKKAMFTYPGMFHEILNEDVVLVSSDIVRWMKSQLP